jgi:hypothetical protein
LYKQKIILKILLLGLFLDRVVQYFVKFSHFVFADWQTYEICGFAIAKGDDCGLLKQFACKPLLLSDFYFRNLYRCEPGSVLGKLLAGICLISSVFKLLLFSFSKVSFKQQPLLHFRDGSGCQQVEV